MIAMGNMSYCRFHNTVISLRECKEAMDEEKELSQSEAKQKENLIRLCIEITDDYRDEVE